MLGMNTASPGPTSATWPASIAARKSRKLLEIRILEIDEADRLATQRGLERADELIFASFLRGNHPPSPRSMRHAGAPSAIG
jgi:hypothetical protein